MSFLIFLERKDAEPQSFLFYEHGNHETNGTFRFLRAFRVLIILRIFGFYSASFITFPALTFAFCKKCIIFAKK